MREELDTKKGAPAKPAAALAKRGSSARTAFNAAAPAGSRRVAMLKTVAVSTGGMVGAVTAIDLLANSAAGQFLSQGPALGGEISLAAAIGLGGVALGADLLFEEGQLPDGDIRGLVRTYHGARTAGAVGTVALGAGAAACEVLPHAAAAAPGLATAAAVAAGIGLGGQFWHSVYGRRHLDVLPQKPAPQRGDIHA